MKRSKNKQILDLKNQEEEYSELIVRDIREALVVKFRISKKIFKFGLKKFEKKETFKDEEKNKELSKKLKSTQQSENSETNAKN